MRIGVLAAADTLGLLVERDVDREAGRVAQAKARDAGHAHAAGQGEAKGDGEGALGVLPVERHVAEELRDLVRDGVVAVGPVGNAAHLGGQREGQAQGERDEHRDGADHHLNVVGGLAHERDGAAQADPPGLGLEPVIGGVDIDGHAKAHHELRQKIGVEVLLHALGVGRGHLLIHGQHVVDALGDGLLLERVLVLGALEGVGLPSAHVEGVVVGRQAGGTPGNAQLDVAKGRPVKREELRGLPPAKGVSADEGDLIGDLEAVAADQAQAGQRVKVARAGVVEGRLLELGQGDDDVLGRAAHDARHQAVAGLEGVAKAAEKETALELGLVDLGAAGVGRDVVGRRKVDGAHGRDALAAGAGEGLRLGAPAVEAHRGALGLAVLHGNLGREGVLGVVGCRIEEGRLGVLDVLAVEADGGKVSGLALLGRGGDAVKGRAQDAHAGDGDVAVAGVLDRDLEVGRVGGPQGVVVALGALGDVDGDEARGVGGAAVGLVARRVVAGDLGAGNDGQLGGRAGGGQAGDVDDLEDDGGLR